MRRLRALVEHYLREWASSGWAAAYHALIELGPEVLPELEHRFAEARDVALRAALVQMARQMRSAEAIGLLDTALRDPEPAVWKEALDGLVALASPAAVGVLTEALMRTPPEGTAVEDWHPWIQEALDQARADLAAKGGAA